MSILQNAIGSIQIGIEDYQADDDRRSVSAVRNISAGILLLYKVKLCRLSPPHDKELLIKKDIRPIQTDKGEIVFEGNGKKTVDVQSIKERFSSLKVAVDWKRFDEINQLRNDLEHYYTSESPDAVREVVAKSFLLIRDFLANELGEDPRELIGEECWAVLLDVADVYAAEEAACDASLKAIDWKYGTITEALEELRCSECHSALIKALEDNGEYPLINLICSSCGHEFSFDKVVEQCIEDYLSVEAHIAIKDGGEPPYDSCPECGQSTFIFAEGCCVACGYQMEYTHCDMCEEPLSLEEQWLEGRCSYCQYKWEKMMTE